MSRARTLLACLLLLLAAPLAVAHADVHVDVDLGHGGRWIGGCTTPVSVTLDNDGRDPVAVSLTIAQGRAFGTPPMRHTRSVFLGPGATRREWFVVPAPEQFSASLSLTVETNPQVPVRHRGETNTRGLMTIDVQGPQPLARAELHWGARIVGVVGDANNVLVSTLPQALSPFLERLSEELNVVEAAPVELEALSIAPFSIEGFDSLVLIDPSPDVLSDPEALDGVLDWVALGGMLVVSPGENAGTLGSSPLAPYLPPRAGAPERRRYGIFLSRLTADHEEKIERDALDADGPWLPLAHDDRGVAYLDRALGNGRIRLLAFDACVALRSATDHGHYGAIATVLSGRPAPLRKKEFGEFLNNFQYSSTANVEESVANVLRQDAFEPPPLPLILLALALYVLVVGPLDWMVLKRLGKQRLTTFTFGGAVLAFTAVAYGASFLVFASGSLVNRVVLVDLADGGRDGRQVIRVHDVVGYYSPRGADQVLDYELPTVIAGATLPGGGSAAEVGSGLPILVSGTETLDATAHVQVAFRSQRVVRSLAIGATGRTLETEWIDVADTQALRIVNGLPVDLEQAIVLLPEDGGSFVFDRITAGGEAVAARVSGRVGSSLIGGGDLDRNPAPADVSRFLAFLSRASTDGMDGGPLEPGQSEPITVDRQILLARTGIARGDALRRGRALLLARAKECPVPLPAASSDGTTHVLIRMEIDLP